MIPRTRQTSVASAVRRVPWIPLALLALSAVPVVAGLVRLSLIANGDAPKPEDIRFLAAPVPVVVHIVAASIFSLLGAFQFSPDLRGRNRWHRFVGRALIPCGLAAAVSGLWMTLFYPPLAIDGVAVYGLRLVAGSAMLLSVLLGMVAIGQRNFQSHAAWMTRSYAIGQGAGTQVLTHLPWIVLFGPPDPIARAFLMGTGWLINIVVVELIIRRGSLWARLHRVVWEPVMLRLTRTTDIAGQMDRPSKIQNP